MIRKIADKLFENITTAIYGANFDQKYRSVIIPLVDYLRLPLMDKHHGLQNLVHPADYHRLRVKLFTLVLALRLPPELRVWAELLKVDSVAWRH